jgi:acyl carrier protein
VSEEAPLSANELAKINQLKTELCNLLTESQFQTIIRMLLKYTELEKSEFFEALVPDARIYYELDLDSWGIVDFTSDIEKFFGIEFDYVEVGRLSTIRDLVSALEKRHKGESDGVE